MNASITHALPALIGLLVKTTLLLAAARGQAPMTWYIWGKGGQPWHVPQYEFISAVVGCAGEVSFPTGTSSLRRDTRWVGPNGSHHAASITDRRSGLRFLITHEDRYLPALFGQTDAALFSSFRILPPGIADHIRGGRWPSPPNQSNGAPAPVPSGA